MTPETAICQELATLLRLACDARAGGGEQGPSAVAGSIIGVCGRGGAPVWLRLAMGKGRFGEGGDMACKPLDLALRLAHAVDHLHMRLFLLTCCPRALGFAHGPPRALD